MVKVTKEEAQKEYLELLKWYVDEEDKIVERAKVEGRWRMGLDSNKDLFVELKAELQRKINALKSMVDE